MLLFKITHGACCVLLAAATAAAEPCPLGGRVLDQAGTAVEGARIEVVGAGLVTASGPGGAFCLAGPLATKPRLLITADRFHPQSSDPIALEAGPVVIEVRLTPLPTEHVVVEGRAASAIGASSSASEGGLGRADLAARPVLRSADLIEAVPGVAMTQHSSGGHAPLILLRGYNLDHGTDFATYLGEVPLNLPSHAHAQGYTDLNFLIPELVEGIAFEKGPYRAEVGNFGTAGRATIELARGLDRPLALFEAGSFGQARAMVAGGARAGPASWLGAADLSHSDGPSDRPDEFWRARGLVRAARGDGSRGWTATAALYRASWFGTDGYPRRAALTGMIGRHGTLDSTDGGRSQRYLAAITRRSSAPASFATATAFVQYYDLDLYSNLTFHTVDEIGGDQMLQRDRRITAGASWIRRSDRTVASRPVELTAGVQGRLDRLSNATLHTVARRPAPAVGASPAAPTTGTTAIVETAIGTHVEVRTRLAAWLRTIVGLRADLFVFATPSGPPARRAAVASPKASVALGPWRSTEVYVNIGRGFHTNHAAGVLLEGASPLASALGAEVGLTTAAVSGLRSSLALWAIASDSELVYRPEAGRTVASRPARRYGVEWLNHWAPRRWLAFDADLAFSQARYTADPDLIGTRIPDAVSGVYAAGVTMGGPGGWFGALRGRYLGARALLEDASVLSSPSFVLNGHVGRAFGNGWTVALEGFNLLDRRHDDIAYFYATRLRDPRTGVLEPAPIADVVAHPAEPRSARLRVSLRF